MLNRNIYTACLSFLFITGCHSNETGQEAAGTGETEKPLEADVGGKIRPQGSPPYWAPNIQPEMYAVLERNDSFGDRPLYELSPAVARKNHNLQDAALAIIAENNIALPPLQSDTSGRDIRVTGGTIHLKIYTPANGKAPFPVIVYYPGGGFVLGGPDAYDASARALAERCGAIVVSVGYRLAPEFRFPTAHNDAFTAYRWVLENSSSFNGSPTLIAVAGEGAGGNLAANVSLMALKTKTLIPVHQLLIYPLAGADTQTASFRQYADAKPLGRSEMKWYLKQYLDSRQVTDPRVSLTKAPMEGMPPTTIITAEIDPLQSEGAVLAEKLKTAGTPTELKNYSGVTHGFFGLAALVPQAQDAQSFAVETLQKSFRKH